MDVVLELVMSKASPYAIKGKRSQEIAVARQEILRAADLHDGVRRLFVDAYNAKRIKVTAHTRRVYPTISRSQISNWRDHGRVVAEGGGWQPKIIRKRKKKVMIQGRPERHRVITYQYAHVMADLNHAERYMGFGSPSEQ